MRVALAALVIAVVMQRGAARADFIPICGDADNDAHITVSDGIHALFVAAELPSTCPIAVCDVNADGRISVTDGVNILRNAASLPAIVDCKDVTGGN